MTENENLTKVKKHIENFMLNNDKPVYVLIDGDRTLIPVDSTIYFLKYLKIDYQSIKSIFQKHGYTYSAFYNVAKFYSSIKKEEYEFGCIESANQVSIYPEFLKFFQNLKNKVQFIIVTSGIKQIWKNIIKNNSLDFVHLIGGSYFPNDNFVIDKRAKGVVSSILIENSKDVFAFGDSLIDFEMLQKSPNPYLIVNEKRNKDIIPVINEIKHIRQISFSNYNHPNIIATNFSEITDKILSIKK